VNTIIATYKEIKERNPIKFELFEIYDFAETKDLLERYLQRNKGL